MERYGLAFGGGGSRGAYEVGVWRALKELNIEISVVVGTSIGSINGALFIQNNFELAEKLWLNLDIYKCFNLNTISSDYDGKIKIKHIPSIIKEFIIEKGIDVSPLEKLLKEAIDEDLIRKSPIDFGLITFSTTTFKPIEIFKEEIPQGQLVNYLMASSCFPGFKPVKIKGEKFIDGGVYNNIPAEMLLRKNIASIITVNIHGPGNVKKFPRKSKNIIEIECSEHLGPIFTFDKNIIVRNMTIGYLDTLKAFEKVLGNIYYFYPESIKINSLLRTISEDEMKIILNSIGYTRSKNDSILITRVIRLLAKTTKKIPDGNSTILTALEITAEILGIDRAVIYKYDELLNHVLEKVTTTNHNEINYIDAFTKGSYENLINMNSDILDFSDNVINIRRSLAVLSPKHFIATIFLSLIKYRIKLT